MACKGFFYWYCQQHVLASVPVCLCNRILQSLGLLLNYKHNVVHIIKCDERKYTKHQAQKTLHKHHPITPRMSTEVLVKSPSKGL